MARLPHTFKQQVKWRCPDCDAVNLARLRMEEVKLPKKSTAVEYRFAAGQMVECLTCPFAVDFDSRIGR